MPEMEECVALYFRVMRFISMALRPCRYMKRKRYYIVYLLITDTWGNIPSTIEAENKEIVHRSEIARVFFIPP